MKRGRRDWMRFLTWPHVTRTLTTLLLVQRSLGHKSRVGISMRVRRWLSESTIRLVDTLDEFARERGYSVTELAIAWLLSQPDISVVLAGMRDLSSLETNVHATSWILTNDELAEIDMIIENQGMLSQVNSMPETFFEK